MESEVILHKLKKTKQKNKTKRKKKKKKGQSVLLFFTHTQQTRTRIQKKKGEGRGDWERKEAELKPPHGCHDWPIRNSTSQITWDTREFISGDTEMSSSRDSYKVNSEWFSSTLARACRARAARRIMSTLVGSN